MVLNLLGVAGVWARSGHAERATQLAGAAIAIYNGLGGVLIASHEPEYEATLVELRTQLAQADFDLHLQSGSMFTVTEAIKLVHETKRLPMTAE